MKKRSLTALILVLMLALAACGGGGNSSNGGSSDGGSSNSGSSDNGGAQQSGETSAPKKDVTIKLYQFKVEIAEQLKRMAEAYEQETGVHVDVETHGGGEDYGALLKAEIAAGNEPEIFTNGGDQSLLEWLDRMTDLSNEPWVGQVLDVAKPPMTYEGKLYGMPMNLEGYGFIYNKDLFAQAGITNTPQTLSELKDAVDKLKAAGITPFESTTEWWSIGQHFFNVPFGYMDDPVGFLNDIKAGKATFAENKQFNEWLDLVDLVFQNAQKTLLTTDYATQVAEFASGKAAMMQQGNWVQPDIDKINPDLNLGVLPMPINDTPGKVFVGVPGNWVVNNKSKHPEEAKAFLDWMVNSETGKSYLTKELKFMPAVSHIQATAEEIGSIAVAVQQQADTAAGWYWTHLPDGSMQAVGAVMQEYQSGKIGRDEVLPALDKAVQDLLK